MSWFIFWILIPIFSIFPVNAQEIIDNNNWIWVWWIWCNDFKYIAAHNYKKLWKIILRKRKWDSVKFWWCKYRIVNIEELPVWYKYKFNNMTYLQTCKNNSNNVFLYSLNK